MELRFANPELQSLYTDNIGAEKYADETVKVFRRRIRHIEASKDLMDLRSAGGVHYQADHAGHGAKCSLSLNESYQLMISEQDSEGGKVIIVHAIIRQKAGSS